MENLWNRDVPTVGTKTEQSLTSEKPKPSAQEKGLVFEETVDNFGPLLKFILDDAITDVDWNGKQLWLTSVSNVRTLIKDLEVDEDFIRRFAQRIANLNGTQFNKLNPVLEAETENLRISILHETRAITGLSCCIRKTPPCNRITTKQAIETNYCKAELLHLLANCVRAHMNIIFCGEPKSGKTELAKYLSRFIPDEERVYTIEDVLEWHYPELKPNADCVQIKIDDDFTYTDAIKASLKQNPRWLCITETRGNEVRELIKGFSTGVSGMTTLHTDDVAKVPQRMVNMVEDDIDTIRFENNVYEFIDVAVLISVNIDGTGKRHRHISQVGFFVKDNKSHSNYCRIVYSEGRFVYETDAMFPEQIKTKFRVANIEDPFVNQVIEKELGVPAQRKASSYDTSLNEMVRNELDAMSLGGFEE